MTNRVTGQLGVSLNSLSNYAVGGREIEQLKVGRHDQLAVFFFSAIGLEIKRQASSIVVVPNAESNGMQIIIQGSAYHGLSAFDPFPVPKWTSLFVGTCVCVCVL